MSKLELSMKLKITTNSVLMSSLFWEVMQCRLVSNYQPMMEHHRRVKTLLHHGRSLKSHKFSIVMGVYSLDVVYCLNERRKIILSHWLDDDISKQPLSSVVKFCYLKNFEQLLITPTNSPYFHIHQRHKITLKFYSDILSQILALNLNLFTLYEPKTG